MKFQRIRHSLLLGVTALGICTASLVKAQSPQSNPRTAADVNRPKTPFLRVTKTESGEPVAMQTAITRYRPAAGELVVDLIGAVHIGEGNYYEQLNRQFENYDVVLYELVAPAGTRIPAGGKKPSQGSLDLISWMQQQAKSTLGLESQLEKIDYQKSNFKHADLSPADISKKMAERGDTAFTLGLSAFAEILRQQNQAAQSPQMNELAKQFANESIFELMNHPLKLKRMMASQFSATGVMDTGLGQSLNQILISDRNEAAMQVLQSEIASGKRKIAIFYGAAHMPDFEGRLENHLGLEKTRQVWIDAWDLTKTNARPSSQSPTDLLFDLLNELGK